MREGQIIKSISGEYTIALGKDKIVCKPRGVFRYKGMSPKVGDIVLVNEETRSIIEIKKRKNDLIRPVIANVDMAFIVTSTKKPNLDLTLLDKLISVVYTGVLMLTTGISLGIAIETEFDLK